MSDKSKFEQEIDEILEKSEENAPAPSRRNRSAGEHRSFEPFTPTVPKSKAPKRSTGIKFNPGNLIVGGLVIIALAAFLPVATVPLAILGVALVAIGYMLWFRKGSPRFSNTGQRTRSGMFGRGNFNDENQTNEPTVKYWRGRRIEEKPIRRDQGKIIDFGSPDDNDKS